jgi:hypothetical protein
MVYVDEIRTWPHARGCFRGGSCHLTADSVYELHAFAQRIGLKRSWFQTASTPHYDLTPKTRDFAIAAGAVFVPAKEQARERLASKGSA